MGQEHAAIVLGMVRAGSEAEETAPGQVEGLVALSTARSGDEWHVFCEVLSFRLLRCLLPRDVRHKMTFRIADCEEGREATGVYELVVQRLKAPQPGPLRGQSDPAVLGVAVREGLA